MNLWKTFFTFTFHGFWAVMTFCALVSAAGFGLHWIYQHVPQWATQWVDITVGALAVAIVFGIIMVLIEHDMGDGD